MAQNLETMLIKIDASTEAVRRELKKLDRGITSTERKVNKSLSGIDKAFSRAAKGAVALAGVFITGKLASSFVETTKQVQALDVRLEFLTGSAEKAAEAQQFLESTADRLGQSVLALGNNYASFLPLVNSGVISTEQARKTMLGLADAAAALGADTTQLNQVMYGLSQALAAGKVQTQDFRQVTAPLPGLMQALDRAAGLTANGFLEMVKSGQVTSSFFRDTLIKALGEFEGAAEANADKVQGAFNRLENAWVKFVRTIEPAAGILTKALEGVTDAINGAAGAVDGLQNAFNGNAIYDFGDELVANRKRAAELRMELERLGSSRAAQRQRGSLVQELNALEARDPAIRAAEIERRIAALRQQIGRGGGTRGQARQDIAGRITALERELQSLRSGLQPGAELSPVTVDRQVRQLFEPATQGITPRAKPFDAAKGFIQERDKAILEQINKQLDEGGDALAKIGDQIDANRQATEAWLRSVSDGFADAILGARSLGDALKGILLQLAKAELSNLIFGGLTGKKSPSIIGGLLGFADGGSPPVNRPSIVGERGPEIFVPKVPGRIVPNHQMGGMGTSISQIFNIQTGLPQQVVAQVRNIATQAANDAAEATIYRMTGRA